MPLPRCLNPHISAAVLSKTSKHEPQTPASFSDARPTSDVSGRKSKSNVSNQKSAQHCATLLLKHMCSNLVWCTFKIIHFPFSLCLCTEHKMDLKKTSASTAIFATITPPTIAKRFGAVVGSSSLSSTTPGLCWSSIRASLLLATQKDCDGEEGRKTKNGIQALAKSMPLTSTANTRITQHSSTHTHNSHPYGPNSPMIASLKSYAKLRASGHVGIVLPCFLATAMTWIMIYRYFQQVPPSLEKKNKKKQKNSITNGDKMSREPKYHLCLSKLPWKCHFRQVFGGYYSNKSAVQHVLLNWIQLRQRERERKRESRFNKMSCMNSSIQTWVVH